jgi:hypothetical protein
LICNPTKPLLSLHGIWPFAPPREGGVTQP